MASNLLEWVIRTAMLVLAGLVTLSILGSIAAVSDRMGEPAARGGRDRAVLAPAPRSSPAAPSEVPAGPNTSEAEPRVPQAADTSSSAGNMVMVPAPPEQPDPDRWLEAIAYALLALAGLFALLLILVWRGVRALGRIADRADLGQHRP
jgi:hypothetical protein